MTGRLEKTPLSTMTVRERTELGADNVDEPVPVLRRAPVLLDNHTSPARTIRRTLDTAPPRVQSGTKDDGGGEDRSSGTTLHRSISHRISRVATKTFGRNISQSLRRSRSARESRAHAHLESGRGGAGASQAQIGKVRAGCEFELGDDPAPSRAESESLASGAQASVRFQATVTLAATTTTTTTITTTTDHDHDDGKGVSSRSADAHDLAMSSLAEVPVPVLLQQGVPMTKVSARSQKSYLFKLDADQGQIIWESKRLRIIPIENIKELRSGSDARYYRQQFQLAREYEDRWITIIYMLDGQYKTLHLIASSLESFQLWDITLRKLYAIRRELMTGIGNEEIRQAVWLKQYWTSTGEQNDHKLSFEQVVKLCRRLNINSSQEDLIRLFNSADSQNRGYLDFSDFQTFVKLLKARPDIDLLYKKLCSMDNGKLTLNVLECFMRDVQKSRLTLGELEMLFVRYCTKTPDGRATPTPDVASLAMSLDAFIAFLLSSDNSAFTGQNGKVHQSMTHPLSDYFISSSHNTYLVGHQLVGYSTVEGYIRALLHGCRSVELDVYDGEHEPVVYHGKTLTSKVSAREVCEAIIKYAFVTSPYPIIISAEIHCSVPQQEMLSLIMHEVFGEALVSAPIEGKPLSGPLPSPEDLKGRILLKAKNLYVSESEPIRERDVTLDTESSSTEASASDSDVVHEIKEELRKVRLKEVEAVKELKEEFRKARNVFSRVRGRHVYPAETPADASTANSTSTPTAVVEQLPPSRSDSKQEHKSKMSAALVALLVYTVGVKCRGINKKEHYAPQHLFSLSETTMNKILKHGAGDLIKHNKTHLVRIYPKGTRVKSTNYLPHRYWAAGAQLVAINWQTFDLGYMINHAMFQRNGRAGYVLKPEVLRRTDDPRKSDKEHLHHHTQHYLEVIVISAQQLPRPKDAMGHEITDKYVDPYVEVSVHTPDWSHPSTSPSFLSPTSPDAPSASSASTNIVSSASTLVRRSVTTMTTRTSAVKNNGFNPVWQETLRLPFECVGDMHDLVFVRFAVQRDGESDGEPIAVYCVSLGSLAMGYRHLPLHDSQVSQYLFSTLFVRCAVYDA